jgi:hypothetical protein
MHKIVRFHEVGGREDRRGDAIQPGKGDVRLKAQAVGLNRAGSMFMWPVRRSCLLALLMRRDHCSLIHAFHALPLERPFFLALEVFKKVLGIHALRHELGAFILKLPK